MRAEEIVDGCMAVNNLNYILCIIIYHLIMTLKLT